MNNSDAREKLGPLLRKLREKRKRNRGELAEHAGLDERVVINLEHGVVNPTRQDFNKVIKALTISQKELGEVGWLLGIIHPTKGRKKFHLHSSILAQRRRRQGCR